MQVLVARFGCIPVPITDFVLQPFEPELDWHTFSVPVAEADVPTLHETLAAISDAKLAQMQVRGHHCWGGGGTGSWRPHMSLGGRGGQHDTP